MPSRTTSDSPSASAPTSPPPPRPPPASSPASAHHLCPSPRSFSTNFGRSSTAKLGASHPTASSFGAGAVVPARSMAAAASFAAAFFLARASFLSAYFFATAAFLGGLGFCSSGFGSLGSGPRLDLVDQKLSQTASGTVARAVRLAVRGRARTRRRTTMQTRVGCRMGPIQDAHIASAPTGMRRASTRPGCVWQPWWQPWTRRSPALRRFRTPHTPVLGSIIRKRRAAPDAPAKVVEPPCSAAAAVSSNVLTSAEARSRHRSRSNVTAREQLCGPGCRSQPSTGRWQPYARTMRAAWLCHMVPSSQRSVDSIDSCYCSNSRAVSESKFSDLSACETVTPVRLGVGQRSGVSGSPSGQPCGVQGVEPSLHPLALVRVLYRDDASGIRDSVVSRDSRQGSLYPWLYT